MIQFNKPCLAGNELKYLKQVIESRKFSGDGRFSRLCEEWFEKHFGCLKALLTTSCTHALEMAAILIDTNPGDEVIMPSYTFVSTANAFVLRGARIVFVDIRPDTLNIDESLLEDAITEKTKAIVPVHYAGISCEMEKICSLAEKHGLFVIEDAAQGVMSEYKGQHLGTLGDLGCYSFHETKNYTCGEGGAIILNNEKYIGRAEIIREKGTNRSEFFRGQVDKYTWVDIGSSYLLSELNAAFLFAQLEEAEKINNNRLDLWNLYYELLSPLAEKNLLELPSVPEHCKPNGHMFFAGLRDLEERTNLIRHLGKNDILSVFHYIPLHSSPFGKTVGRFHGEDKFTTSTSNRLLRLPIYYNMKFSDVERICGLIKDFLL
ncbi:MAG: dTDP-4-amino-4,6-dideoxygalactose transaminase [Planctomycetota bacterium]|jgi:dTDP-4-amino-4,6-dideoxygalactose transaminase